MNKYFIVEIFRGEYK